MARSRTILSMVAAGAVLALAVLALRPSPIRVDTGTATRGALRVTVDEEGETRVRHRVVIDAPVAGRLERIWLDEGDGVDRGTVVARMNPLPIDPRLYAEATARRDAAEAAKSEADTRVEQARAAHNQARREADRARKLAATGTVSPEERERAELDETTRGQELEAALFAARSADSNLQAARAALLAPGTTTTTTVCAEQSEACLEIRSPIRGRVLRVLEESERIVATGTPLLSLGDPEALEVVVDVLSTDAVKIRPGAPVLIEDWGGDRALQAKVRLIEPSGFTKVSALGVEEQRVNVILDFVDPPASLGDGYRVEARVVTWEAADVLKAPSSALFRRDGKWTVFLVNGGRAQRRTVEAGERNAFEVEIRSGLSEGDTVILHPTDLIDDGTRVEAH